MVQISKRIALVLLCPTAISVAACNSHLVQDPTCFDGWSVTAEEDSYVWKPTDSEAAPYLALLPSRVRPVCWHRFPSGDVVLVYRAQSSRLLSASFSESASGPILKNQGIIVTAD